MKQALRCFGSRRPWTLQKTMDFSSKSQMLVGELYTSGAAHTQLSALRSAGFKVRVLIPGQMGGWKLGEPADPKRVNFNCDADGRISRVTFG
jgi:hypothetical protein